MSIRVYLTGRLSVEVDQELVIDERGFRGRQARLVFAYLLLERNRVVPQEELAEVIWQEDIGRSWEMSLRALISGLRGFLSVPPLESRGVAISRGSGQYQLTVPNDIWVDVEAGAIAIDEAEGGLRTGAPQRILGPANVAANICRRPFLSGIEGRWVDTQRRKLERGLLRALDCLSTMWLARGEAGLAAETATEAVEIDPFRESGYQLLMQAYAASGNRAEAISVYGRLTHLLGAELGTGPTRETDEVYRALMQ